ncbi:MAG: hypothetical protein AB8G99_26690 [Planctomycetaceae bacterium]
MDPSPNPYQTPDPVPEPKSDWTTWNPFQSEIVREIASHLTPSEKRRMTKRGLLWGLWSGFGFSLPLGFTCIGMTVGRINWFLIAPCIALAIGYLISVRPFLRSQKELLADTEWAQANGINAQQIKLTRWF